MTPDLDLLACPACAGAFAERWRCGSCGTVFPCEDGIPRLRADTGADAGADADADDRTERVRRFYEEAPFPGYPPRDSLAWLRGRAGRSPFARCVDEAIAGDARIVEIGCGTGQTSLYLARADRQVVAMDLSRHALRLGAAAAQRFGIGRVQFIEGDLHRAPLRAGAFDVVYASGVLHHTPDPRAAFARIAPLVRPGGVIVLGLYNRYARLPLRLRRAVAQLTGHRWIPCDPVLRDRASEPARREAWIRDQYRHPEEHRHTLGEVQGWFAACGIDYVRAYPDAVLGAAGGGLFEAAVDGWPFEGWLAQIGWIRTLGHEGGLFVTVGRRRVA